MRFPLISRSSHEELMSLVVAQAAELKEERKILLDRLALIGLGGPLYQTANAEVIAEDKLEVEEAVDPEQDMVERLMRLRHRPAKLADALTRKAFRDHGKRSPGPKVAWIPQNEWAPDKINGALDQAEEMGKRSGAAADG